MAISTSQTYDIDIEDVEYLRHIRRYLSSDPLLPVVHKRFMISQFKDGFQSKL